MTLKTFCQNKGIPLEMKEQLLNTVTVVNIVAKGEIAHHEQFCLL